jgi:hypothetical protein
MERRPPQVHLKYRWIIIKIIKLTLMRIRVRNRLLTLKRIRIRILFLVNVMRMCDHWSIGPPRLHFEPLRLHCKHLGPYIVLFCGTAANEFWILDADPAFNYGADPHPAFHSEADPDSDPVFRNNADPDPTFKNKADPGPQYWKNFTIPPLGLPDPILPRREFITLVLSTG